MFMVHLDSCHPRPPLQQLATRTIWRRMLRLVPVWALFGSFIGITGGLGGGPIGIISGAIAGVIVISWLGVLLGLMGGEPKATFLSGLAGALIGLLYSVLSGYAGIIYNMNLAFMIG